MLLNAAENLVSWAKPQNLSRKSVSSFPLQSPNPSECWPITKPLKILKRREWLRTINPKYTDEFSKAL